MSRGWQKFENGLHAMLPVGSCFFLVLLTAAPWPGSMFPNILAPLVLVVLGTWVLARPDLISARWSFAIGLTQDILAGHALGVMALSYLLVDFILRVEARRFQNLSFLGSWLAFAGLLVLAGLVQWAIAAVFSPVPPDLRPVLLRMACGILLYPLMAALLSGVQRRLPVRI